MEDKETNGIINGEAGSDNSPAAVNSTKRKGKIHEFFTEVMSINEAKVSCLLLILVSSVLFGAYMYYSYGELSKIWSDMIETILYCVTGINVSDKIAGEGGFLSKIFHRKE